jgi:short-subunit dehydrogenase
MTALVTGASAGIGVELAREFAKDKIDLILVARREEKLNSLAEELRTKHSINVYVIAQDLSLPGAADLVFNAISKKGMQVDYLVNNAGFGDNGEFVESDLSRQEDMINLNILTLTKLSHLFGAEMKKRKSGTILNVASTAAFVPGPLMSVYFATKHYVLAFSEGIALELKPYNVHVSTLCPGPTESEFGATSGFKMLADAPPGKFPSSAEVATYAYAQMKNKKGIFIPGLGNKIETFATRFVPRSIVRKIVYSKMKN